MRFRLHCGPLAGNQQRNSNVNDECIRPFPHPPHKKRISLNMEKLLRLEEQCSLQTLFSAYCTYVQVDGVLPAKS